MAVLVKQNGGFEITYNGPYSGINVQMPENLIPDNATPASNDFIFRNAELRSRPSFNPTFISTPSNRVPLAIGTVNGTFFGVFSGGGIYKYNFGTATWTLVSALATGLAQPVMWRTFNGIAYMANAVSSSNGGLSSFDGTNFATSLATAGGATIGATFVDELDNHLIMANTSEFNVSNTVFGARVRWSAINAPNVWDPTVNVNAGFNDFLDVPDGITGLMMLGRVGYILRTDGITEMDPTGVGTAPFQFNHLWASQFGIGNTKFYASAQYGLTGVIISRDNIYAIQGFQLNPIGGTARDAILRDLGIGSGLNPVGVIVPYTFSGVAPDGILVNSNSSVGTFPYLTYMLFVTLPALGGVSNGTRVWVYNFDENNWTNFTIPGYQVTGKPSLIINNNGVPVLMVPLQNTLTNNGAIGIFDATNFNDANQGSSHSFKVEDIVPNRVPTVRRVVLTYRDLGQATITVSVSGTDDNLKIQTASATVSIGNASPTNALMTQFVDLQLSAFRPQLTISRAAGGGPVSISTATMIGDIEKTSF